MTDTVNNSIPFVPENTIDPAAGLNLSLNTVDALLQVLVQTVGANTPPAGVEGQRHIVGTTPTGPWAGQANRMARFLDGAYQFYDARYALNAADGLWYVRSASTWAPLAGGSGGSGTVTSVGFTAPTGFDVTGSPVTASGTLALSFSTGYSLPTNANQANWSAAFGWGNHATAGYEKQLTAGANITIDRTDPDNPVISASASAGMTNPMTTAGDIVVGGASGAPARLAKGTDGQMLLMAAGAQAYGSNPILAGYKETLETMATNAIDVSTSNVKKRVLTAASTLTISGSSSGFSHSFTLLIEGGNTHAVTWPASFKWLGGVPTLTAKDVITGFTVDNGTMWIVSYAGSYA